MKAVIMAGGEGSRLRPLTCDLPKPMARLCGRPVLEYILDLLAQHGVTRAALTMRYLPDRIVEHFPDGRYGSIELDFVEETEPLGTAGSVKNACDERDDDVLVISGDAMCDFDLGAFAQAHREGGAAVTILAKKVGDPREYGLIDADESGKVLGFIEKPAFSQAVSDLANTGIYMLSRRALDEIPGGRMYDFAKNLFPALLEAGQTLRCWEGEGYWCDIGDLDSYASCQRDMLAGKVSCRIDGERDARGNVFAAGRPTAAGLDILPPVYIGRGVRLADDVLLESGAVLDDGCTVGRSARVSGSVVLPGAHIGERARMTGAIVCAGATVKAGAMLFESATVGAGAVIGERSTLGAGVKVWNRKRVGDGSSVTDHVKHGAHVRSVFEEEGITGQVGVELTPEFCARLGAAVGSLYPAARIAVGCSSARSAEVLKDALCAGMQSAGADVVDFGASFAAQFAHSMNFCAAQMGVFVRADGRASVRLLSHGGLPATRAQERDVEGMLLRGEFTRVRFDAFGDRVVMPGFAALYQSRLMRLAPGGLSGLGVRVQSHTPAIRAMLGEVLQKLGADPGGPLVVEVSSQGERLRVYDPEYGTVRAHRVLAVCAAGEMERGRDVALPFDAPRQLDDIADALGQRALRYLDCPADDADRAARELAASQMWSRDALMQAVMFCALARRSGSVSALMERWPGVDVAERTVNTSGNPAGLLRAVGEHRPGGIAEGVLVHGEKGVVLLKPLKRGNGVKILAEAVGSETAAELCDDMETLLRRAMDNGAGGPGDHAENER